MPKARAGPPAVPAPVEAAKMPCEETPWRPGPASLPQRLVASMLGRDETESGHSENKPTAFQGCAYCPARRGYHWLLWTAWTFWERLWTKRYLKELPSRGTVPPI